MMDRVANTGLLPREEGKTPYGRTRAPPDPPPERSPGRYKRKPVEHRLDRRRQLSELARLPATPSSPTAKQQWASLHPYGNKPSPIRTRFEELAAGGSGSSGFEERYEKAFGSIDLSSQPGGTPQERSRRARKRQQEQQAMRVESALSPEYRPSPNSPNNQPRSRSNGPSAGNSLQQGGGGKERQRLEGIEQEAWEKYQRYEEILSPKEILPPKTSDAVRRGYRVR